MLRPCTSCGTPAPSSQCADCAVLGQRERHRRNQRTNVGYDSTWQRLSRRVRRLQPFCSDCGTTTNLTADHLPEAWLRRERGQVIRVQDVDVCCGPCNTRRGSSRPGGMRQADTPDIRRRWGPSSLHTEAG